MTKIDKKSIEIAKLRSKRAKMRPKRPKKATKRGQEGEKTERRRDKGGSTPQKLRVGGSLGASGEGIWGRASLPQRRIKAKFYTPAPARQGAADLQA